MSPLAPVTTRVRKDGGAMATDANLSRAAETLRRGGLVAFPTETVYGLGADADNAAALARLYTVKGRPGAHPVIVHIGEPAQLADWAADVPVAARRLGNALWPGPLTVVVRRAPRVLDAVTGGGDTVGVRVPDQPLALALLREFGGGIAAPSANRFGHVSPTTAGDVRADLSEDVDVVLDGGPCTVGVESTIVDCTGDDLVILRPGGITRERVEEVSGRRVIALLAAGQRVAVLAPAPVPSLPADAIVLDAPAGADEYAHVLYARLREVDRRGVDVLLAVPPPDVGVGAAVGDRLRRAAGRE